MAAFDYAVLTVMAVSVLLGLWRGVVSEILALAAWVVALFAARAEAAEVANWLPGQLNEPALRLAVAYVAVVVAVLLVFSAVRMILKLLLKAVGLGVLDRLLGGAFGALRGVVILLVAVLVAGMTPLPRMDWWQQAGLSPPLETAVLGARPWLPPDVAKRIRYR